MIEIWSFWSSDAFLERHCFAIVCNFNLCFPGSNRNICQSIKENELFGGCVSYALQVLERRKEKKIYM